MGGSTSPGSENIMDTNGIPGMPRSVNLSRGHPAPFPTLPSYPDNPELESIPPKPTLSVSLADSGITLTWNVPVVNSAHADITSYEIFGYQETDAPVTSALWECFGNLNAIGLSMGCTLRHFRMGHRYHFTVRAVDCYGRFGPFSEPVTMLFDRNEA